MKTTLLLIGTFMFAAACGQSKSEKEAISATVKTYSESGDAQDADRLDKILHDQHRLVWHDGTKAPFVLDKEGYLAKIKSKEWGGDKRQVKIESVESFDGVNAIVKAILDGEKAQMRSLYSLIKIEDEWQIVEELVNASFK